nr:hypothetical protein [Ardenticatena sp.]
MYEDGWVSDESGFDFVERFRRVLFDPTSSPEEQREAARILVQIGTDDAVDALHWFIEHGESDLAFDIQLALREIESQSIEGEPDWETQNRLFEHIVSHAQGLFTILGHGTDRYTWIDALAESLSLEGHDIIEGARAILRYNNHPIELLPIDLIVDGLAMVYFWTLEDDLNAITWYRENGLMLPDEADEGPMDPLDECYTRLRTADLFMGVLLNVSGNHLTFDVVYNNFYRRPFPHVEYILSVPPHQRRRR